MKTVIDLLNERPALKDVILELADVGRNEHEVVAKRMLAYAQISDIIAPLMLEVMRENLSTETEPKFEYQWIRGARVKVRVN